MLDAELRLNAVDLLGQTLIGRYRLDALLDVGADRMLWRAYDQTAQRAVSLQIWPKGHGPSESTLQAAMASEPADVHEVFARIEGTGVTAKGQVFGVYPSLSGQYVSTWLEERVIGVDSAVAIATTVSRALAALHTRGHAHSALDRSVVVDDGEVPLVRVVDAGLGSLSALPLEATRKIDLAKVGAMLEALVAAAPSAPSESMAARIAACVARTREDAAEPFADMQALADGLLALGTPAPALPVSVPAQEAGSSEADEGPSPLDLVAELEGKKVEEADEGPSPLDLVAELEGKKVEEADEGPSPLDLVAELEGRTIEDARPVFPEPANAEPHPTPELDLKAVGELEAAMALEPALDLAHVAAPHGTTEESTATREEEALALPEEPALIPAPAPEPEMPVTAGPVGLGAGPLTGTTPRPATVQMAVWPEKKKKVEPAAVVVALLLLATIAVFLFVLLPGPDRPATPLEALRTPTPDVEPVMVGAADTQGGTADPDTSGEAEVTDATMAVLDLSLEDDEDVVADVVAEVSAEVIEDTVADTGPETTDDTAMAAVDVAIPDTAVAPDTIVAPDTTVAAPDTTIAPDTTVAAPDTTVAPDTAVAAVDTAKAPAPDEVPDTDLPVRQVCNSKDEIKTWLDRTEDAIKKSRRDGKGAGVTKPLLNKLLASYKDGQPVTLQPYQIYHIAMNLLDVGSSTAVVGQAILAEHK